MNLNPSLSPKNRSMLPGIVAVCLAVLPIVACGDRDGTEIEPSRDVPQMTAEDLATLAEEIELIQKEPAPRAAVADEAAPNGELLARFREAGVGLCLLEILSRSDSSIVHVDTLAECGDLEWSPSGRKLAYSEGLSIWIADADGSSSRRVHTGPADVQGGYSELIQWVDSGRGLVVEQFDKTTGDSTGQWMRLRISLGASQ